MESELQQVLINSCKAGMISFMDSHPDAFDEAIKLALGDEHPFCWRAASLLWSCMKDNDQRMKPYVKKIMSSLSAKDEGHQRELLKILFRMNLNEKQESYLFDVCMSLWEQINSQSSVRHNAFRYIVKMAKKYPELSNEINFLTQNRYMETLSPGARKSVYKMCKGIKK